MKENQSDYKMTQLPIISIIIPVYNVEQYIVECLQSVESQTYQGEIECLLVDDCATDSSIAVAQRFINQCNGHVIYRVLHNKKNMGLSAARNIGLENAMGEYIYFLDSDDFITPKAIQDLYAEISENPAYAIAINYFVKYVDGKEEVYRDDWLFNEKRIIEPGDFFARMVMEKSNHASTSKLYRKELLSNVRFQVGKLNEDSLFIIDLSPIIVKNGYKCIDIPKYTYYYRMRQDSISCGLTHTYLYNKLVNTRNIIIQAKNNKEVTIWLKQRILNLSFSIIGTTDATKDEYFYACNILRMVDNSIIFRSRRFKTFIHILLYKYFAILMYYIEKKK